MNAVKAREVASWLIGLGHKVAAPVKVTIQTSKKKTVEFFGATYEDKINGERFFYLLGEKPSKSKECFVQTLDPDRIMFSEHENGVWYVAGWYAGYDSNEVSPADAARYDSIHVHGHYFQIKFWDNVKCGGTIDLPHEKEYKRLPIRFEIIE